MTDERGSRPWITDNTPDGLRATAAELQSMIDALPDTRRRHVLMIARTVVLRDVERMKRKQAQRERTIAQMNRAKEES